MLGSIARVLTRRLFGLLVAASVAACASAPTRSSELEVRRVWDEYLASKKGQFARYAGEPSPLWDAAEQKRWPMFDLAGFYLADGARECARRHRVPNRHALLASGDDHSRLLDGARADYDGLRASRQ
jgi:hypothetical protein